MSHTSCGAEVSELELHVPIGCSNEDDCLSLRDGRWGRVVGFRVTHVAAGVWAGVLFAAAWLASRFVGEWRLALWNLLAAGVLVAALAGGWFILLQAIVLRRWCLRCNLAHSAAFVALVVVVILAPAELPWLRLAGVAIALVGMFIVLQVLFPAKQFAVTQAPVTTIEEVTELVAMPPFAPTLERQQMLIPSSETASTPVSPPIAPPPTPSPPVATTPTIARLVGGRVALRLDQGPLLGSPGASHVVALMMDYLCRDCLHVHRLLLEAIERSQGTLAILLLPVPMDPQTHPSLKPPKPPYDNPRAYARLALALHHLSLDAFFTWDRHIIHADPMPLIADATALAETLVAPDDLTRALTSPAIDPTLREAATWFITAGPMQVPKLLLPRSIVTGRIPDLSALMQIIEKEHSPAPGSQTVSTMAPARPVSQPDGGSRPRNVWSSQRIR